MKAVNLLWHGVLAAVLFYMAAIPAASRSDSKGCTRPYLLEGFSNIILQISLNTLKQFNQYVSKYEN